MDRLTVEQRSHLMARIRSRDTKPELIVRSTLHRLGYRYTLHKRNMAGTPDLVFPRRLKVIFVNGCFWHGHSCKFGKAQPKTNTEFWGAKIAGNAKRDKRNIAILRKQGWRVMVVWECCIKKGMWLDATVRFLDRAD